MALFNKTALFDEETALFNETVLFDDHQGFMLLGLWPSPLFYCQPQGADEPTKGKFLGVTMLRQFRTKLNSKAMWFGLVGS